METVKKENQNQVGAQIYSRTSSYKSSTKKSFEDLSERKGNNQQVEVLNEGIFESVTQNQDTAQRVSFNDDEIVE